MTEQTRPRLPMYLKIIALWALPGALAVFIGRVTWDLTWPDTWDFASIAVVTMVLPGSFGATTQDYFLETNSHLLEEQPFVFGAPWVLVSVLAAALSVEITVLH